MITGCRQSEVINVQHTVVQQAAEVFANVSGQILNAEFIRIDQLQFSLIAFNKANRTIVQRASTTTALQQYKRRARLGDFERSVEILSAMYAGGVDLLHFQQNTDRLLIRGAERGAAAHHIDHLLILPFGGETLSIFLYLPLGAVNNVAKAPKRAD